MQLNDSHHPNYKKLVLIVGVLLIVIIAALLVWYWYRHRPLPGSTLSEQQQEVIINKLNDLSKLEPRPYSERYQMVTGRTYVEATSTAATAE